jgi:hypothetical protein
VGRRLSRPRVSLRISQRYKYLQVCTVHKLPINTLRKKKIPFQYPFNNTWTDQNEDPYYLPPPFMANFCVGRLSKLF